ncbi:MAG: hypothetical protein RQ741_06400 [Wenzhouxiangellaceae bacterium]|nr:hypothetical protein [Wenzhouxiangellaceae bacterium]
MKIDVIETCRLLPWRVMPGGRVAIDGVRMQAKVGAWAFYVPSIHAKILHSVDGTCHCIHATAPGRETVFEGHAPPGYDRYTAADWHRAYATRVARRAAENYIAARRLHDCGLGPRVTACVAVRNYQPFYSPKPSHSFGIVVEDLRTYPKRPSVTLAQFESAGVAADRTRSCLRQPIRGYVSDLNSVVGVMPVDAAREVQEIQQRLEDALNPPCPPLLCRKGSSGSVAAALRSRGGGE